jgi:predicted nucleic acid-binding protein
LTALHAFLRRHRRIALDTNIFVYQVEANPRYMDLTDPIFVWLSRPECTAVTSTITMTELLVPAYRSGGSQLVSGFYALLTTYPNLDWIAPSLEIADIAARIRAAYRLRTPDALQAATALHSGAAGLITNNPAFERVAGVETLVLERLL